MVPVLAVGVYRSDGCLASNRAGGLNELARGATMIYPIAAVGVFANGCATAHKRRGKAKDIAARFFQAVVNQTISELACGNLSVEMLPF